jgi:hypothetical protein
VDGEVRATIDPDDFSSGFGTWSGTSFAAPILAGEIAQALIDDCAAVMSQPDAADAIARSWSAITKCTKIDRP